MGQVEVYAYGKSLSHFVNDMAASVIDKSLTKYNRRLYSAENWEIIEVPVLEALNFLDHCYRVWKERVWDELFSYLLLGFKRVML